MAELIMGFESGGSFRSRARRADENWRSIDMTLRKGTRGLRGGSSLGMLLAKHGGVGNRGRAPRRKTAD